MFFAFWHYREFEDGASLDGSIENIERGSIASFGSGNTTDSDNLRASEKVSANRANLRQRKHIYDVIECRQTRLLENVIRLSNYRLKM